MSVDRERVPFEEGFLEGDLTRLEEVRLAGSRCTRCGIALLRRRRRCESCSSADLRDEVFAPGGVIYSYTFQRYTPPPPYEVTDSWLPRCIAWIDLDDAGPRVLALVDCSLGDAEIGSRVCLSCRTGWTDGEGRDVVIHSFVLAGEAE